jgi:hypothetical protein
MLLKTIYYHYFIFYNKLLSEANPHMTTVLALSFAESLIVNVILSVLEGYFYCMSSTKWQGIGICLLLIVVNSKYYIRNNNGKRIVDMAPKIFNSKIASIIFTIFFTSLAIYILFNMGVWELAVLERCR